MELESYPTKLKRDLRVSSPQPLFRALADLLEESGFRLHSSEAPELEVGALPGTATFKGRLLGVRDSTERSGKGGAGIPLIAFGGIIIAVMVVLLAAVDSLDAIFPVLGMMAGGILLASGLGRLREPQHRIRRLVHIQMEGESYQAGATRASSGGLGSPGVGMRVERSGVVSDARVTVYAGVGYPQSEAQVSRWLPQREAEVKQLIADMPGQPMPKEPMLIGDERMALEPSRKISLPARRLNHQIGVIAERFALPEPGDHPKGGSGDDS
jgi:hypothetical protein